MSTEKEPLTLRELLKQASQPNWKWADVNGAGLEIFGVVPFKANCTEFTLRDASQPVFTFIACEKWIQFPPDQWQQMQKSNAELLIRLANSAEAVYEALNQAADGGWAEEDEILMRLKYAIALLDGKEKP